MKAYFGEFLGTFILVLIGCGSVAMEVINGAFGSLLAIALVWGCGVALAIFVTRKYSHAHLNPAVSLAFYLRGQLQGRHLPFYFFSQTLGAFSAAFVLYLLISSDLLAFETAHSIVRGTQNSYHSALMFGEFFPNPGYESQLSVSVWLACLMEILGTFSLIFVIFLLTSIKKIHKNLIPFIIGLTVTSIIYFVAPYTQAGLNPARDFGPRLLAYFSGWGDAAFPTPEWSFLTVYIISPFLGAILAYCCYILFRRVSKHD